MPVPVLLEIAVGSADDAEAAVAAGAERLEVNTAVALGGLTPSLGLFAEVRRRVAVPLIAMIRPRAGGFCYSTADFAVMLGDAATLLAAGADGLAFGVLGPHGSVDVSRTRKLREMCGTRAAVFHRAFDLTPDPFSDLQALIDLGLTRVMTSGQAETAVAGSSLIALLIRAARGRIEVMPAGGINAMTAPEVVARTACDQVHAGVRGTGHDPSAIRRPDIRFDRTDSAGVAALRAVLSELHRHC